MEMSLIFIQLDNFIVGSHAEIEIQAWQVQKMLDIVYI